MNVRILARIAALSLLTVLALTGVKLAQPCATEDSSNCTWYADVQGNGQGGSFTDVGGQLIRW
jgi:hypothetical protein